MNLKNLSSKPKVTKVKDQGHPENTKREVVELIDNLTEAQEAEVAYETTLGTGKFVNNTDSGMIDVFYKDNLLGSFASPRDAVDLFLEDSKEPIKDDVVERQVGNNVYKTRKFASAEEANKFLEQNPGYGVLDVENDDVYVALSEDKGKPV